ncbi:uncharacterized protein KY384_008855 [Bacidia gigantensis]|uniref:uncharacterized protein n=1 Tax=Bacidia gigantensis TaxID=2732470 RepID=UPI001D051DB8|nr:uncharacterized protein KY384_008855 [Bacidia gigantensis]KAG8525211.1 hypothetical protein KY384_008855 [Bacidia gigantensis]
MTTLVVGIELGGIGVLLLFSLCYTSLLLRSRRREPLLEGNEDGDVTKASIIRYNDSSSRNTPANVAVLGLIAAIARSTLTLILSHQRRLEDWTHAAAWLLLLAQCVVARLSQQQYILGFSTAVSSLLLILGRSWSHFFNEHALPHTDVVIPILLHIFSTMEVLAAAVIAIASLSSPRSPDVYCKGRLVDRQDYCSALARYSFSWALSLLAWGKAASLIYFSDLPAMSHKFRAQNLEARFLNSSTHGRRSIFSLLLRSHKGLFIWQWCLTIVQSFTAYGPQFAMYKILTLLEAHGSRDAQNERKLWVWALALGAVRVFQTFVEARLAWLSFAELAISIRAQLSAAIFGKCMRMDIVKDGSNSRKSDDGTVQVAEKEEEARLLSSDDDENDIPLEKLSQDGSTQETKIDDAAVGNQDAVNLLSVDAQRIADFSSFSNIFPSVTVTSLIAIIVLVRLIGLISLVAGLSASLILVPLNTWSSKRYNQAQIDLMKARDDKAKLLSEAMQGIRQIKFSATEDEWEGRIMDIRRAELSQQRKIFMWALVLRFCWVASPIFLSVAALSTYAWTNGSLSASLAFTSLAIFGNLEWCLSVVPLFIAQLLDARVSGMRIMGLLNSDERLDTRQELDDIEMTNVAVSWPGIDTFRLSVDAKFPQGELSVIHGRSGSGKSLLLASIIGEAKAHGGKITIPRPSLPRSSEWMVPGMVAFVSQTPWLENATLKSNILFGLPFHESRYTDALQACALGGDLKILPDGDLTEIGARGVNLSGGQRWRVSLARAFYSRASILIMDDIFSAVDVHVGYHIYNEGLMGPICTGRTRILATHHVSLILSGASCLVHVQNGIANSETRVKVHAETSALDNESAQSLSYPSNRPDEDVYEDITEKVKLNESGEKQSPKKFVEDESREHGHVRWATYSTYLRASGSFWLWIPALAAIAASQLALLGRGWWMKKWTAATASDVASEQASLKLFLMAYVGISLTAALLEILKCLLVYLGGLRASKTLFSNLISKVLRANTRWLDTVPFGRIMNRFTADFNAVDSRVPAENHALLSAGMSLFCIFIAGILLSPYMAAPYLVLLAASLYYTLQYIGAAREIRRLEATARSPILDLFGNAMPGLDTLRAFGKVQDYTTRMCDHIDSWSQSTWAFWLVTQWMSFRMGLIGALFTTAVAIAIAMLKHVDASLAGFVLLFALNYSKAMEDTIRRSAAFQFNMNSIERIVEFTDLESEPKEGQVPPASWPSEGQINTANLSVSYAPHLPPVLHNLSITIAPGERVGIVGRTGAGKSSLTLALFRCLQVMSGRITIDGIDISQLRLKDFRQRMTLIPQDPVLFSGTIRSALDPLSEHTDKDLLNALRKMHLFENPDFSVKTKTEKKTNPDLFANLDHHIHDHGSNLSQGQKQLLCLARATLSQSRNKIVVLDEATSAVDTATDAIIQRTMRELFHGCTVIVIAHRLETVSGFDRVIVMEGGRVVEEGPPALLIKRTGGVFEGMVRQGNQRRSIEVGG